MIKSRFILNNEDFKLCEDFSKNSAGTQREYRSGGSHFRSKHLIEKDTLRGKVGEFIVKKFLKQDPLSIKDIELDFNVYERGKWDKEDFILSKTRFSVKSVKWFSKWLLLETKDILRGDIYDTYILVAVDENFRGGNVKGFATKDEILYDSKTLKLKKGDYIPKTNTVLDADNHARHSNYLNNSLDDWQDLVSICKD